MLKMKSFITNFQSPVELDDLIDRYEGDGMTNIDHVLQVKENESLIWTVNKNAQVGDVVLFMCAKTSIEKIRSLVKAVKEENNEELLNYTIKKRDIYSKYAGKIIAIGVVADSPYQTYDSGYSYHYWRSPWYAQIKEIKRLENTVSIDEFRDFIKVSRTGAITILSDEQWHELKELIETKNNNIAFEY